MSAREEALPYYKWLWRDFRSNRKVQRMGWIARGLYRELIDEAWAEGSIPNDMSELADICGCPIEVMDEAWPRIVVCWRLDESGRWVSDKLESLRTEVDTVRVTKARAGRIGGLTKLKNKLEAEQADVSKVEQKLADAKHELEPATECHIAEQKQEQSKSISKVSEPNGSSPRANSGKPDPVEAIYQAYPRRVGRQVAIKAIKRAVQHVKARGHTLREAEVWLFRKVQEYARSPAGNDGEFTPHPATWFNQGRYDDDPKEWLIKNSERGRNGHESRNGLSQSDAAEVAEIFSRLEAGDAKPFG